MDTSHFALHDAEDISDRKPQFIGKLASLKVRERLLLCPAIG